MKLHPDTVMDATVDDCHHDGASEWGTLRGQLYIRHKMYPAQKWIVINYLPQLLT